MSYYSKDIMNSAKKLFAFVLLLSTQQVVPSIERKTLPNSDLRVIVLTTLGSATVVYCSTLVATIINKIIENDPTIDETTLRQKVVTTLRYGFGLVTGLVGIIAGMSTIVNANKDPFIT